MGQRQGKFRRSPAPAASLTSIPSLEILSWQQTQAARAITRQGRRARRLVDLLRPVRARVSQSRPVAKTLRRQCGLHLVQHRLRGRQGRATASVPKKSAGVLDGPGGLVNVLSSDPNEEFYTMVRLGGPPAVFVYDRDGKLAKRFDNSQVPKTPEFTYKNDVAPWSSGWWPRPTKPGIDLDERWRHSRLLVAGIVVADHVCEPIDHLPHAGELVLTARTHLTIGGSRPMSLSISRDSDEKPLLSEALETIFSGGSSTMDSRLLALIPDTCASLPWKRQAAQ